MSISYIYYKVIKAVKARLPVSQRHMDAIINDVRFEIYDLENNERQHFKETKKTLNKLVKTKAEANKDIWKYISSLKNRIGELEEFVQLNSDKTTRQKKMLDDLFLNLESVRSKISKPKRKTKNGR